MAKYGYIYREVEVEVFNVLCGNKKLGTFDTIEEAKYFIDDQALEDYRIEEDEEMRIVEYDEAAEYADYLYDRDR